MKHSLFRRIYDVPDDVDVKNLNICEIDSLIEKKTGNRLKVKLLFTGDIFRGSFGRQKKSEF